jgi:hypothetical protein
MKPQHFIDPADISSDVGSVIKHPAADQYAWDFSDDPLLIHPEANPHGLDAILDALIAAGVCLPVEKQETQNRITAALGTFKTILDILPQSLAPLVKTVEQMKQEGWFPEVER